jgi:hypothetical protein
VTGINIKVRFGASGVLRVRRATVKEAAVEIDETDGESGGFGECDDNGVLQADVTFEGYVRSADAAPPNVNDILANVLVAWDGNVAVPVVNKRHLFPKLKILDFERTGTVRGGDGIVYTLTCKSSGTYKPMGVA